MYLGIQRRQRRVEFAHINYKGGTGKRSPEIPPPGILTSALDLFLDECTSVIGEVTGKDSEG